MVVEVNGIKPYFFRKDLVNVCLFGVFTFGQDVTFLPEVNGSIIGDAWPDIQYTTLGRGVLVSVLFNLGTRTHQAHVSSQHVPQLRQFVELPVAQEGTYWGDAGIPSAHGEQALLVRAYPHAAEFQQGEWHPAPADALLAIQHRTRRTQLDQYGDNKKNRQQEQQAGQGEKDIQESDHGTRRGAD